MLASLDWTPEDVYGRDPDDRKSVAWLVRGQRIGPITTLAVTLRGADGSTTWIYRRDSQGAEPFTQNADSASSPPNCANYPIKPIGTLRKQPGRTTPETPRVRTDKTAKRWDPETAALIKWFLGTTPPTHPFQLQRAVFIARPDAHWKYLQGDIAAGPTRARGKTGALQGDLRHLYRVLRGGSTNPRERQT